MTNDDGPTRINILLVFASPRGADPLRLGAEDRVIRECIERSALRDRIKLDILHASTIHDVRRAMLKKDYDVVHFSGHGTGHELVFEDTRGRPQVVPPEALAEFLSSYSPPISCVVLNACDSIAQGELLSLGIPYAVGFRGSITDEAALEFSRGFYDALAAGKDVEDAFREGSLCVKLTGLTGDFEPVLFAERMSPEQDDVKILSQYQVELTTTDPEEEGFLDYIFDGKESFELVAQISERLTGEINALSGAIEADTVALQGLDGRTGMPVLNARLRIVNSSAGTLESFATNLDQATPALRDAYSRAIDCYGKAARLLATDFDTDSVEEIKSADETVEDLYESVSLARQSVLQMQESVDGLPRLTKIFTRSKRHASRSLGNLANELGVGLELTREVQDLMNELLEKDRDS